MNDDHADSIAAYARTFAGIPEARAATMKSMDETGMDLDVRTDAGAQVARVAFDHTLLDADDAKDTLIRMARQAG